MARELWNYLPQDLRCIDSLETYLSAAILTVTSPIVINVPTLAVVRKVLLFCGYQKNCLYTESIAIL